MKNSSTVNVNGQAYDSRTGLPVSASDMRRHRREATTLHRTTQKSVTLRRNPAAKPQTPAPAPLAAHRTVQRSIDIARHPKVAKIAAPTEPAPAAQPDIAPRSHPHVAKANQQLYAKTAPQPMPSRTATAKEIKEAEIARALAKTPDPAAQPKKHKPHRRKHVRLAIIIAAILATFGAIIWLSLPTLSVHLASSRAGITATMPHYLPSGFHLRLPIYAEDNKVSMTFSSDRAGEFTLGQTRSSLDSTAVRAMVEKESNGYFSTRQDRGLTIYIYDSNAAWVNKGMLYTIKSSQRLEPDAITRIANSL